MSEKKYTEKEVALAVLKKCAEMYKNSDLFKTNTAHEIEDGQEPDGAGNAECPEQLQSGEATKPDAGSVKSKKKKPEESGEEELEEMDGENEESEEGLSEGEEEETHEIAEDEAEEEVGEHEEEMHEEKKPRKKPFGKSEKLANFISKRLEKRGKSPVGKKISKLVGEGKPQKQAIAIALEMKRKGRLTPEGGYKRVKKQMPSAVPGQVSTAAPAAPIAPTMGKSEDRNG